MMNAAGVRLSAAVMTHPARVDSARHIAASLPQLNPTVVVDTDPGKPESCLRNSRRAWGACDPTATHHLVLQDDIEVCEGFAERLVRALAAKPEQALCLFTEQGSYTSYAVRMAALASRSLAPVLDHYVPTVALAMPAGVARSFAQDDDESAVQDDVALLTLLDRLGVRANILVPNLVEHTGEASFVGNDHMGARRAAWFRREQTPAGSADAGFEDCLAADVPFVATDSGLIATMLYDEATDSWARGRFQEFLDRQGVELRQVRNPGAGAADAMRILLAADLSEPQKYVICNLRDALYGLGFQAGGSGRLDRPAGLDSLRTAPHGILRWWMSVEQQEALREPLDALLRDAAERGFADGLAARANRVST